MANGVGTALGLSIGATNLAAITSDNSITRKPVLTLYPDRPAEVGIPAENPRLQGPGVVITGFVNRVGDPRPVVAPDGSVHRSEVLIADALRALAYAATRGRPLPDNIAVTYPSHWESHAVEALGAIPEWSQRARPLLLIPDAAATLLAVRTNAGIPPRGTVAVCDFGGSGTSITLMHADGDYRALAPTVRHRDFSGDLMDQALLSVVIANMPSTGAFPSGTAAIGSLSRLRSACRVAKEQLSSSTMTTLTDGLTGTRGEIRVTRHELDDAIGASLNSLIAALDETLVRNGIRDLVAVVSTGGGANLPTVTTTLSRHFRVPVATTPRPQLTAALGAALRVAQGHGDAGATLSAPAAAATARTAVRPEPRTEATATAQAAPARPTQGQMARAWSATGHNSRVSATGATGYSASDTGSSTGAAQAAPETVERKRPSPRRHLLPAAAIIIAIAAVLLVGTAVAIGLNPQNKSATTPTPALSTTPAAPRPAPNSATAQPAPPPPDVPVPSTSDTNPPADTETPTTTTPRATPQAAPPAAPAPPAVPHRVAAPPIPPIPGVNESIPGLDRVNQIIQEIEGNLGVSAVGPLPGH